MRLLQNGFLARLTLPLCCANSRQERLTLHPKTMSTKPLSDEWIKQFRHAEQIVRTGRDEKGNYYNAEFGRTNQAMWCGEHVGLLLNEIDRLRGVKPQIENLKHSPPLRPADIAEI